MDFNFICGILILILGIIIGHFLNVFINMFLKSYKQKYLKTKFLVMIITPIVLLSNYITYGLTLHFIKYSLFICIMLILSIIDFYTQNIYLNIIFIGILIAILFIIFEKFYFNNSITMYIYPSIIVFLTVFLFSIFTKSIGDGEAYVFCMVSLFLGNIGTMFVFLMSFILGGPIGILLFIIRGPSLKNKPIAFVPFIFMSSFLYLTLGEFIIQLYLEKILI